MSASDAFHAALAKHTLGVELIAAIETYQAWGAVPRGAELPDCDGVVAADVLAALRLLIEARLREVGTEALGDIPGPGGDVDGWVRMLTAGTPVNAGALVPGRYPVRSAPK